MSMPARRRMGSIPAGAGGAFAFHASNGVAGVYPRRCGGSRKSVSRGGREAGLSPQVRGERPEPDPPDRCPGSIPAGAGGARAARRPRAEDRVYPRRCGGSGQIIEQELKVQGLSPQVRGEPDLSHCPDSCPGSIPAGAGGARGDGGSDDLEGVYPRRCGGSWPAPDRAFRGEGLSPQVRGSLPGCRRPGCPRGLSPQVRGSSLC